MAPDGLVAPVVDGPSGELRLHGPEKILDHPEMLVLQRHLSGGQVRVRAQDPLSVEAGFRLRFGAVDLEAGPGGSEVLPVALVSHQGFVPLLQLLLEPREDHLPVAGVLPRLVLVVAHDIAPALDAHLLHLQGGGVLGGPALPVEDVIPPRARTSSPLSLRSSSRPSVPMTRCRTAPSSRRFSTICR